MYATWHRLLLMFIVILVSIQTPVAHAGWRDWLTTPVRWITRSAEVVFSPVSWIISKTRDSKHHSGQYGSTSNTSSDSSRARTSWFIWLWSWINKNKLSAMNNDNNDDDNKNAQKPKNPKKKKKSNKNQGDGRSQNDAPQRTHDIATIARFMLSLNRELEQKNKEQQKQELQNLKNFYGNKGLKEIYNIIIAKENLRDLYASDYSRAYKFLGDNKDKEIDSVIQEIENSIKADEETPCLNGQVIHSLTLLGTTFGLLEKAFQDKNIDNQIKYISQLKTQHKYEEVFKVIAAIDSSDHYKKNHNALRNFLELKKEMTIDLLIKKLQSEKNTKKDREPEASFKDKEKNVGNNVVMTFEGGNSIRSQNPESKGVFKGGLSRVIGENKRSANEIKAAMEDEKKEDTRKKNDNNYQADDSKGEDSVDVVLQKSSIDKGKESAAPAYSPVTFGQEQKKNDNINSFFNKNDSDATDSNSDVKGTQTSNEEAINNNVLPEDSQTSENVDQNQKNRLSVQDAQDSHKPEAGTRANVVVTSNNDKDQVLNDANLGINPVTSSEGGNSIRSQNPESQGVFKRDLLRVIEDNKRFAFQKKLEDYDTNKEQVGNRCTYLEKPLEQISYAAAAKVIFDNQKYQTFELPLLCLIIKKETQKFVQDTSAIKRENISAIYQSARESLGVASENDACKYDDIQKKIVATLNLYMSVYVEEWFAERDQEKKEREEKFCEKWKIGILSICGEDLEKAMQLVYSDELYDQFSNMRKFLLKKCIEHKKDMQPLLTSLTLAQDKKAQLQKELEDLRKASLQNCSNVESSNPEQRDTVLDSSDVKKEKEIVQSLKGTLKNKGVERKNVSVHFEPQEGEAQKNKNTELRFTRSLNEIGKREKLKKKSRRKDYLPTEQQIEYYQSGAYEKNFDDVSADNATDKEARESILKKEDVKQEKELSLEIKDETIAQKAIENIKAKVDKLFKNASGNMSDDEFRQRLNLFKEHVESICETARQELVRYFCSKRGIWSEKIHKIPSFDSQQHETRLRHISREHKEFLNKIILNALLPESIQESNEGYEHNTLLHYVIRVYENRYPEQVQVLCELLINNGASVDSPNKIKTKDAVGQTPYDIAQTEKLKVYLKEKEQWTHNAVSELTLKMLAEQKQYINDEYTERKIEEERNEYEQQIALIKAVQGNNLQESGEIQKESEEIKEVYSKDLKRAVRVYDYKKVLEHVSPENINAKDNQGYSPLYYAVQSKDSVMVDLLVLLGANPGVTIPYESGNMILEVPLMQYIVAEIYKYHPGSDDFTKLINSYKEIIRILDPEGASWKENIAYQMRRQKIETHPKKYKSIYSCIFDGTKSTERKEWQVKEKQTSPFIRYVLQQSDDIEMIKTLIVRLGKIVPTNTSSSVNQWLRLNTMEQNQQGVIVTLHDVVKSLKEEGAQKQDLLQILEQLRVQPSEELRSWMLMQKRMGIELNESVSPMEWDFSNIETSEQSLKESLDDEDKEEIDDFVVINSPNDHSSKNGQVMRYSYKNAQEFLDNVPTLLEDNNLSINQRLYGGDINMYTNHNAPTYGDSLLDIALQHGTQQHVEMLLEKNASLTVVHIWRAQQMWKAQWNSLHKEIETKTIDEQKEIAAQLSERLSVLQRAITAYKKKGSQLIGDSTWLSKRERSCALYRANMINTFLKSAATESAGALNKHNKTAKEKSALRKERFFSCLPIFIKHNLVLPNQTLEDLDKMLNVYRRHMKAAVWPYRAWSKKTVYDTVLQYGNADVIKSMSEMNLKPTDAQLHSAATVFKLHVPNMSLNQQQQIYNALSGLLGDDYSKSRKALKQAKELLYTPSGINVAPSDDTDNSQNMTPTIYIDLQQTFKNVAVEYPQASSLEPNQRSERLKKDAKPTTYKHAIKNNSVTKNHPLMQSVYII